MVNCFLFLDYSGFFFFFFLNLVFQVSICKACAFFFFFFIAPLIELAKQSTHYVFYFKILVILGYSVSKLSLLKIKIWRECIIKFENVEYFICSEVIFSIVHVVIDQVIHIQSGLEKMINICTCKEC